MAEGKTSQLGARMTKIIMKSSLGTPEAVRARRTTGDSVRNRIVHDSGTLRDSGSSAT